MNLSPLDPVAKRRLNGMRRKVLQLAKLLHEHDAHPDYVDYRLASTPNEARAHQRDGLKKVGDWVVGNTTYRRYARYMASENAFTWLDPEVQAEKEYERLVRQAHYCECVPNFQYALAGWSAGGGIFALATPFSRTIEGPVVYWPKGEGWAFNHLEAERLNSRGTSLLITPDVLMFTMVRPTPAGEEDGMIATEPVSVKHLKHFDAKAKVASVSLDADPFDTVHFRPANIMMLEGDYPISEITRSHIRSLLYGRRPWAIEHGLLLLRLPHE